MTDWLVLYYNIMAAWNLMQPPQTKGFMKGNHYYHLLSWVLQQCKHSIWWEFTKQYHPQLHSVPFQWIMVFVFLVTTHLFISIRVCRLSSCSVFHADSRQPLQEQNFTGKNNCCLIFTHYITWAILTDLYLAWVNFVWTKQGIWNTNTCNSQRKQEKKTSLQRQALAVFLSQRNRFVFGYQNNHGAQLFSVVYVRSRGSVHLRFIWCQRYYQWDRWANM